MVYRNRDIKKSDFTEVTSLTSNDYVDIVRNGTNYKVALSVLLDSYMSGLTSGTAVTPWDKQVFYDSSASGNKIGYMLDVISAGGKVYFVDDSETDQGANSSTYGTLDKTLKDHADSVGPLAYAVVVLRNTSISGTTYTLTTSLDLSSYTNLYIMPQVGAIIDGAGTLTVYSPANIIAGNRQYIFGSSLTVAFSVAGTVSPFWNYPGTGSWHTYINALDGMLAADSTMLFPDGEYTSTAAVTPSDNRTWISESRWGAKLIQDTANDNVVTVSSKDNVIIDGFYIEGTDDDADYSNRGVYLLTDCNKIEVKNCYITKVGRNAISLQQSANGVYPTNIKIHDNYLGYNQGNGIFFNGVVTGEIVNNIIEYNGQSHGSGSGYEAGVGIVLDCYYDNQVTDVIVAKNIIKNNYEGGIMANAPIDTIFESNIVSDNGHSDFSSNTEDSNGIIVRYKYTNLSSYLYPDGCVVNSNIVKRSYRHGIALHGASNTEVENNLVFDNGYGYDSSCYGIYAYLYGTARHKNVNLLGNTIQKTSGSSYQKWGIRIEGILGGAVNGNMLYQSGSTGQIQILGEASYLVEAMNVINNTMYSDNTETAAIVMNYFTKSVVDNNYVYNAGTYGMSLGANCTSITIGEDNKIFDANTADYLWTCDPMDNEWKYKKIETGLYDFSSDGGAVSDIVIGTIPNNFTITKSWYEVLTPPTSGGSATIAISTGQAANEIVTATAYDDAVFGAGYHDAIPDGSAANFTTKTTAKRNVNFTIAGAALTAGKIRVWWEVLLSE